jgi:hypothetical protein
VFPRVSKTKATELQQTNAYLEEKGRELEDKITR